MRKGPVISWSLHRKTRLRVKVYRPKECRPGWAGPTGPTVGLRHPREPTLKDVIDFDAPRRAPRGSLDLPGSEKGAVGTSTRAKEEVFAPRFYSGLRLLPDSVWESHLVSDVPTRNILCRATRTQQITVLDIHFLLERIRSDPRPRRRTSTVLRSVEPLQDTVIFSPPYVGSLVLSDYCFPFLGPDLRFTVIPIRVEVTNGLYSLLTMGMDDSQMEKSQRSNFTFGLLQTQRKTGAERKPNRFVEAFE